MSRQTTYIGLTEKASKYISKNAAFETKTFLNKWNKKSSITLPVEEKIGTTGMFQEIDILKYKMKDGSWAEEFVQSDDWHGGPVIFMGLRHGDKVFEWTQKEIEKRS